jgi:Cd2+/Zn2+-exporting ATPase
MLILGLSPEWGDWIMRALTFLVISCPCALVISIPLSFFAGIGGASNQGVLVKGSNYLETMSETKYVVFDKTGTLTKGVFEVTRIHPADGFTEAELLEYAALAESYSTHPISKSLQKAYKASKQGVQTESEELKSIDFQSADSQRSRDHEVSASPVGSNKAVPDKSRVTDVEEISGHGIIADVDGRKVAAGNVKLMTKIGVSAAACPEAGTVVHVAIDKKYAGYILISDVVKPHAKEAIQALKKAGVKKTIMLTGDRKEAAEAIARELGIDEVHAELLPEDKVTQVEKILAAASPKEKTAFVGDGINDAPVLSRADIGIAMGAMGSDAAIEAADVVLMDDDPLKISKAIRISRKCLGIVYQNIYFAIGIKLLCLLLGALGIANMWAAIFADVGVMVIAVLNAIRALNVKKL